MNGQRPEIVRRKAQMAEEKSKRKLLIDFLKSSAIITADILESGSGSFVVEFHNGGITRTELKVNNII